MTDALTSPSAYAVHLRSFEQSRRSGDTTTASDAVAAPAATCLTCCDQFVALATVTFSSHRGGWCELLQFSSQL